MGDGFRWEIEAAEGEICFPDSLIPTAVKLGWNDSHGGHESRLDGSHQPAPAVDSHNEAPRTLHLQKEQEWAVNRRAPLVTARPAVTSDN